MASAIQSEINSYSDFWKGAKFYKKTGEYTYEAWVDFSDNYISYSSVQLAGTNQPQVYTKGFTGSFKIENGEFKGGTVNGGESVIASPYMAYKTQTWQKQQVNPYTIDQSVEWFWITTNAKGIENTTQTTGITQKKQDGKYTSADFQEEWTFNTIDESTNKSIKNEKVNSWTTAKSKMAALGFSEGLLDEYYGYTDDFKELDIYNYFDFYTPSKTSTTSKTQSDIASTEEKPLYDKYYSDLTSNNSALISKTSKKINWKTFSDFSSADSSFYSALEWGSVNIKKMQKFQTSVIDWTLVGFSDFQAKQYKQTNWSQVTVSSFTSSEYTEINWGKVSYSGKKSITKASGLDWTQVNFDQVFASKKAYKKISWSEVSFSSFSSADYSEIQWDKVAFKGKKSVSYSALDWSQVDFQDFTKKTFKQLNWKEAQTTQLTDSQYSAINWSYVALKGKKSADYSKLDWSKVITNDTFSAKAAKKVDWNQISASALDSAALAKLKQDAFSAKNKKLTAWLDANTTSTTGSGSQSGISFAGIAQPQSAGALAATQETSGSAAEVFLAAVEKQTALY